MSSLSRIARSQIVLPGSIELLVGVFPLEQEMNEVTMTCLVNIPSCSHSKR